jgi:hypothetical protein
VLLARSRRTKRFLVQPFQILEPHHEREIHDMKRNLLIVSLTAWVLALVLTQGRAEAQVKPLKIKGGGPAPDGISLIPGTPAPHSATGNATELGNYTGAGFFQILDFTGPLTAEFSSAPNFVFVAANGDQLAMTYGDTNNGAKQPGQVTLVPNSDGSFTGYFVAEFNPDLPNCTGRFAKLTGGSLIMYAVSDPFFIVGTSTTPFTYTWQGSGTLTFGR